MDPAQHVDPTRSTAFTAPRAPRVPFTVAVQHHAPSSHEVVVDYAQDISTSGLFVACRRPYTVGTLVDLDISNPGEAGQYIHAQGHVVRIGIGSSGEYGMGILFHGLGYVSRRFVEHVVLAGLAQG